jgi:NAD(P)-dependent dehydrogenase (short-subunit alcohol dehydrogenase family)
MRMKREDWDAVLTTNLTAAFVVVQAAIRPMLRQRSGRIISISSVVGQMGNAGQANYAASKAGLIGFSKALARELASRRITVNVIARGRSRRRRTPTGRRKSPSVVWARSMMWRQRRAILRPTRQRILLGTCWRSMAACTCDVGCVRRSA